MSEDDKVTDDIQLVDDYDNESDLSFWTVKKGTEFEARMSETAFLHGCNAAKTIYNYRWITATHLSDDEGGTLQNKSHKVTKRKKEEGCPPSIEHSPEKAGPSNEIEVHFEEKNDDKSRFMVIRIDPCANRRLVIAAQQ